MNIFDLSLQTETLINKKLNVSPLFAMKGGMIDQYIKGSAIVQITALNARDKAWVYVKDKSWLIGPQMGLNTKWLFTDLF